MLFFCSTVRPRLIVKPHAVYLRSFEGESEVNMNVTIKGGVPKPMVRKLLLCSVEYRLLLVVVVVVVVLEEINKETKSSFVFSLESLLSLCPNHHLGALC